MPIKAILFDFDGVLTTDQTGSVSTIRHLAQTTDLTEDTWWQAFTPFNNDLLLGRLTHEDIWPRVCAALGRDIDFALLHEAFDSTPMNQAMLDYAASLKPHYATAIVTDNKADRMSRLSKLHSLHSTFDAIIVSAECGFGKDGIDIFEHTLRCLAVTPDQAVFIDNSQKNLIAPAAIGISVAHFNEATDTTEAIVNFLASEHGVQIPQVAPNNSFKPKLLRSGNGVAG